MADGFLISDLTGDLTHLLKLTNLFEVDDEGFWILPDTGKRYVHKLDANDAGQEIVVVQDPMPTGNYLTFNPFAEGLGKPNPATAFYYRSVRVAFNHTFQTVLMYVARSVLTSKQTVTKGTDAVISPAVVRMTGVATGKRQTIYDIIDEEMIAEFKRLFERVDDTLVHVPYYTRNMTAKVKIDALEDPEWDGKYATKDIRKRSVAAFKALIMGILGINKAEELSQFDFKYQTSMKSSPRFHATMSVYLDLYDRFNDIIPDAYATDGTPVDQFAIDLGKLTETIERFPLAYAVGKHMMQVTAPPSVKPVSTQASDTSGLRFATPGVNNTGGRTSRFPGAPTIDNFSPTGMGTPALSFGGTAPMGSRFKPAILNENPPDPFAPATRVVTNPGFGGGMGMTMGAPAFGGGFGFGNNTGFGSPGGGLNFAAPSNFGEPGTKRWIA